MLSQVLAYFSAQDAPVHFPGAAFLLAAVLAFSCLSMLLSKEDAA
jgi:hypothetical protein